MSFKKTHFETTPPNNGLPKINVHYPHGKAVARTRLNGHYVYLGPAGSRQANDRYHEVIQLWLANGRRWPLPVGGVETVEHLSDRFAEHAISYYVKRGKPTSTYSRVKSAMALLNRAGYGPVHLTDFDQVALKAWRRWLAEHPHSKWSRTTINRYVTTVQQMFVWGADAKLVDPSITAAVKSVRPIRRRRPIEGTAVRGREPKPITAVDDARVEATIKHLPPVLAAAVSLQQLTGMRPGEVLAIRPADLAPTANPEVTRYLVVPEVNKTDHHDTTRIVLLGPKAMKILQPLLPANADDYVFRKLDRHGHPFRGQAHYSTHGYHNAIEVACAKAFEGLWPAKKDKRPAAERAKALAAWTWTPNQLRHTAATKVAREETLDHARELLGHASVRTTEIYVDRIDPAALAVAARRS